MIPVMRGSTAHSIIRRHQPDVVVLDMYLEHAEGGWMILDRMRLEPETAHMPVIMCSADHRLLQEQATNLQEEGSCILEKPFDVADLLSMLENVVAPGSRTCGGR